MSLGELLEPAEEADPDALRAQLGGLARGWPPRAGRTGRRPRRRERAQFSRLNAYRDRTGTPRRTAWRRIGADRLDAGRVAVELGQVALAGPAAVAVHDDRDVARQVVGVDHGARRRGRGGRGRRRVRGACAAGGASVGRASGARATRPRGPPVPSPCPRRSTSAMCRSVVFWSDSSWRCASSVPTSPSRSSFLRWSAASRRRLRISTRASSIRLWTTLHEVLATLLGQRRDVEPHDRAVDVRHEPDVALGDRLLDGARGRPGPTAG